MTNSRPVEWHEDMEIAATVWNGQENETITLSWHNLQLWLRGRNPNREDIVYYPKMYTVNPLIGYGRVRLCSVTIADNTKLNFYEAEPFGYSFAERFECYRSVRGIEVFIDSGPLLPALMMHCVDHPRMQLDFAINNNVLGHFNNLQNIRENNWMYDILLNELETPTPTLPVTPYD